MGLWSTPFIVINFLALFLLLLIATVCDHRSRRIPNWLTYGGCLVAITMAAIFRGNETMLATDVIGAFAGFGICFAIMFIGWILGMGAGDVKLAAAIGAFLGVNCGLSSVFFTYLISGTLVAVWAILATQLIPQALEKIIGYVPISVASAYKNRPAFGMATLRSNNIPMAGFFFVGTFTCYLVGPLF